MEELLERLSALSAQLDILLVSYNDVVFHYLHGDSLLASNLCFFGFDVREGNIADVKFYVVEDNPYQHMERSFSVLANHNNDYHEKKYYRNDFKDETVTLSELKRAFDKAGILDNVQQRYISYGEVIKKYTRTATFPCFGYGFITAEDEQVIGAKLYYTFFSYKEKSSQYGEVNHHSAMGCIQHLLGTMITSEQIKESVYALFEKLRSNIVLSLFALNTDSNGEEEYKIYFHILDETHLERQKNIALIGKALCFEAGTKKIAKIVDSVANMTSIPIFPAEHCISIKNNRIMYKFYYRVKR